MSSPYQLVDSDNYSYSFITDNGIKYSIYFLDYSYMFSDYDPSLSENIYTFNIDVIEGDAEKIPPDTRIAATVLEVCNLFFENLRNVLIYVCDSVDKRQLARKRKFDTWFREFDNEHLHKEDGITEIDEDTFIYNSLIIHKSNDNFENIIIAFQKLNESLSDKDNL